MGAQMIDKQSFRDTLKRPIVFFDLETTGVDPQMDRIVEFAGARFNPDGTTAEMCILINPGGDIPKEASDIHGIHTVDVKDAPRFSAALPRIVEFIKGCDLAGYNARRFDVPLLQAELARCNHSLDFPSLHIVDAYDIFQRREPRSLVGALRFYCGKEHVDAHSALADVRATVEVFEAQLERYKDLPYDVTELHELFFDEDSVDLGGKLRWVGENVCINFGKHKGTPLKQVPVGYLQWMQKQSVVGADASVIIDRALVREFPRRIKPKDVVSREVK